MVIEQRENWLGNRLKALTQSELLELIEEIANFRRTGLLKEKKMRTLEKQFSENVSHTPIGDCMRLIEDEILFEAARRFHNEKLDQ